MYIILSKGHNFYRILKIIVKKTSKINEKEIRNIKNNQMKKIVT